jgi:hypothetical protein
VTTSCHGWRVRQSGDGILVVTQRTKSSPVSETVTRPQQRPPATGQALRPRLPGQSTDSPPARPSAAASTSDCLLRIVHCGLLGSAGSTVSYGRSRPSTPPKPTRSPKPWIMPPNPVAEEPHAERGQHASAVGRLGRLGRAGQRDSPGLPARRRGLPRRRHRRVRLLDGELVSGAVAHAAWVTLVAYWLLLSDSARSAVLRLVCRPAVPVETSLLAAAAATWSSAKDSPPCRLCTAAAVSCYPRAAWFSASVSTWIPMIAPAQISPTRRAARGSPARADALRSRRSAR